MVIIRDTVTEEQLLQIESLFNSLQEEYPDWFHRVECSFTPLHMMNETDPPQEPRPWFGNGVFYNEATYGNEWLINQYLLTKHGVALTGPEYYSLVEKPIGISSIQKAAIGDFYKEWEPLIANPEHLELEDPHIQSYVALNICRILYTIFNAEMASKQISSEWVFKSYPEWTSLIKEAAAWEYGKEMKRSDLIQFVEFAKKKIEEETLLDSTDSG